MYTLFLTPYTGTLHPSGPCSNIAATQSYIAHITAAHITAQTTTKASWHCTTCRWYSHYSMSLATQHNQNAKNMCSCMTR